MYDIATKFCVVIKLDEIKMFTRSTTSPSQAKHSLTQMLLMRDLFAVANHLVLISLAVMTKTSQGQDKLSQNCLEIRYCLECSISDYLRTC